MKGPPFAVEVTAPAKINLFLKVTGRREDGYHELYSLMCCVGLYDRLHLAVGVARNEIICDHPDVPSDENNLALKAALSFNRALPSAGISPRAVSIRLSKNIPCGGGLGGGSSDAAAVLKALNQVYGEPFEHRHLLDMALLLGADVPFFIAQVPSLAAGIGEKLTPYKGLRPWGVLLVYPGFGISTSDVFRNLNFGLTKSKKKLSCFSFIKGNFDAARHLCNDLEPGVIDRFPVVDQIKKELIERGAIGALMSGSGSTVFGLYEDIAGAMKAGEDLTRKSGWFVYATRVIT